MNVPVRALLCTVFLVGFAFSSAAGAQNTPEPGQGVQPDDVRVADLVATAHEVGDYLNHVAYDELVQRSADTDAFLATLVPPAPPPVRTSNSSSYGGTTVGECTGFVIPDYIIQRESGGNPSAMNPSGAYGCAQTLLSHYSGGSCSGFDPYTIEGQRACVDKLSDGGTNLAPWAATR